jgi:ankyrin repeat protein
LLVPTAKSMIFLSGHFYRRDPNKPLLRARNKEVRVASEAAIKRAIDAIRHLDPVPESYHIALREAADNGRVFLVEWFLKVDGINPNFGVKTGETFIDLALRAQWQPAVVKPFLDRKEVDLNKRCTLRGFTGLSSAIFHGNIEIAKLLLDRDDIDVNLPDPAGHTPLFVACLSNQLSFVDLLVSRDDVDPNPRNRLGETPLLAFASD